MRRAPAALVSGRAPINGRPVISTPSLRHNPNRFYNKKLGSARREKRAYPPRSSCPGEKGPAISISRWNGFDPIMLGQFRCPIAAADFEAVGRRLQPKAKAASALPTRRPNVVVNEHLPGRYRRGQARRISELRAGYGTPPGQNGNPLASEYTGHRRAPVQTKSICRPAHWPQISRSCQSGTLISAP